MFPMTNIDKRVYFTRAMQWAFELFILSVCPSFLIQSASQTKRYLDLFPSQLCTWSMGMNILRRMRCDFILMQSPSWNQCQCLDPAWKIFIILLLAHIAFPRMNHGIPSPRSCLLHRTDFTNRFWEVRSCLRFLDGFGIPSQIPIDHSIVLKTVIIVLNPIS